jgi:hypothetical protein
VIGAWLVTVGYVFTILAGFILFKHTPPDVGGTHALMIPVSKGDRTDAEREAILARRTWNQIGFVLLSVGAIGQLAGYWADRVMLILP